MGSVNFLTIVVMFLIPFVAVCIPILIGEYYGLYIRKKTDTINDSPVGAVVGAALGLLAFMLAFTFQIVDSRYSNRKELLLEEVSTIRTTYLDAGLIPEPYRSSSRKLLLEYTDLRADIAKDVTPEELHRAKLRSDAILDNLWSNAEALAAQDRSSEAYSLFTVSVSDLFEVYHKRLTYTFEYRIPAAIMWVLSIITVFSTLLLGYQFGISGKSNRILAVFISIIFASVMFLILVLDRPETGIMRLNQTPVLTLHKELHEKK
ncbi:bestrophin-like domain [Flavobacterium hauense]